MREPFQRPLSERLNDLPKGISDTYQQFVQGLSGNYLQLLRTALQWTLFASGPVRVVEIMDAFTGIYRMSGQDSQGIDAAEKKGTNAVRTADRSEEVERLKAAVGPFLEVWDEEGEEGEWWVALADASQVRQFCISRDEPSDDDDQNHQSQHDSVCVKCGIPLEHSKALLFSEKELHLHMAISSLRHLNNPIFQTQCGELSHQWNEERLKSDVAAISNDNTGDNEDNPSVDSKEDSGGQSQIAGAERPDNLTETMDAEVDEHTSVASGGTLASSEAMKCDDCSASDESADAEDRQTVVSAAEAEDHAGYDGEIWRQQTTGIFRYEINCWYYHVRRAEDLWSPDDILTSPEWSILMSELDRFTNNDEFFKRWQWALYLREIEPENIRHLPWKPLHVASFLGLTCWAQQLLAGGHSLAEESSGGITPLHAACLKADRLSMLKLLLKHGADPNDKDDSVGAPCLHRWLCRDQSYKALKLFIDHGADPSSTNIYGYTAMHYFATHAYDSPEHGASEAIKLLNTSECRSKKEVINMTDLWQSTPLHHLLRRREVPKELLKEFILQGADVNVDDDDSLRPLQNASYWGDAKVVQILLPNVSHVDDPDRHGRTALHEAAWAGHRELVEILINEKCANPNVKDFHNRTPLFFACLTDPGGRTGDSRGTARFLIKTLYQNGFSFPQINFATKRNRTPLRQAAASGLEDILNDLLHMLKTSDTDTTATVNEVDTQKGRTGLHCAAAAGHCECVRLLLEFGADVSITENSGKTALQLCYEQWALTNRSSFEETALLLCDRDSTAVGDTELPAIAATNNSRRMLVKLACLKANLARPDQYGWTPLALAKRSNSLEAKNYLEEYSARDAQLPGRWLDPKGCASLSESGLDITFTDIYPRAVLTSDRPLPAHLSEFYFEIRSLPAPESVDKPKRFPELAIGFCTLGGAGLRFPGWTPASPTLSTRSWAYHGDDGGFYDGCSGQPTGHASPYGTRDTVGCGIDLEEGRMWFTLNGKRLQKEFTGISGRLFPVVGLVDDVVLETRFAKPFFSDNQLGKADAPAKVALSMAPMQDKTETESVEHEKFENERAEGKIIDDAHCEGMGTEEVQAISGAEQEDDAARDQEQAQQAERLLV